MNSHLFGRHAHARVDAALHGLFESTAAAPTQRDLLQHLLDVLRKRTSFMTLAPTSSGPVLQVEMLRNLLQVAHNTVRAPYDWPGTNDHPLRVASSLAGHLFGHYATPRFLAAAWFGGPAEHRQWAVALSQGTSVASLSLPMPLTRRMRHLFLHTPDHVAIAHALRRAEVLGLGGDSQLVTQILATKLSEHFANPTQWRAALQWLVNCGEKIQPLHMGPIVDFLHSNLMAVDLRGRTFASVMQLVRAWHGELAQQRLGHQQWAPSRLPAFALPVAPTAQQPRAAEWFICELLDSGQLAYEGRSMRHCVASYASACVQARSSIWSLRHRWMDDFATRSVLTIEVQAKTKTIVQIRSKANAAAPSWPLQLVRQWAQVAGLRMDRAA